MWYRYRRGPRLRHLWFLVFPLFFIGGHHVFGFLFAIASIIVIALIARAIFAVMTSPNTWGMSQNQWYQPRNQQSYYQPTQQQQPYYQPKQQPTYQQGYQQPYYQPTKQQASEQPYEASQQAYDQYEQPHAEYPQEMPPMQ